MADRLLLFGPVQEPLPGFEKRVVARLVAEGERSVKWFGPGGAGLLTQPP